MSWDAVILKIDGPAPSVDEFDDDKLLPLGDTESVAGRIREAFPDAEWDNPRWARWGLDDDTGVTIDLNSVESTHSISVSVSGNGNPIPALLALAAANEWVVMDIGSSEFLSEDDVSSDGWEGYQKLLGELRKRL